MNRQLAFIAVSVGFLTGCTSFNVVSPQEMTSVRSGSGIPIDVTANPRFNAFNVAVDTHPTAPVPCPSATECKGPLTALAGRHAVMFSAAVPCWYCTNQQYSYSVTRSVCVSDNPAALASSAVVASSTSDHQVWTNASDSMPATTAPGVSAPGDVRWRTYNLSGGLQAVGLIQSVANDCLCMQSRNDPSNPGIMLAWCDFSKATPTQIWESWPSGNGDSGARRYKNNGGSQNCITEGTSGSLETQNCDLSTGATPNSAQIWTLTDVAGHVVSPF